MSYRLPVAIMFAALLLFGCSSMLPDAEEEDFDFELIPGQYIVVFVDKWDGDTSDETIEEIRQFTDEFLDDYEVDASQVRSRYEHALRGFTAEDLTEDLVAEMEEDDRVDYITQDSRGKWI